MTKYIFLDVDGVLNSTASIAQGIHLDPRNIMILDMLVKLTHADIIISSTWRHMWVTKDMKELLRCTGLTHYHRVKDSTPRNIGATCRGEEIQAYLNENPADQYVILDDASDFLPDQQCHFVQTDFNIGLTIKHLHEAEGILMGETI